jgi:steroid 5-alpha reductase family enzyme
METPISKTNSWLVVAAAYTAGIGTGVGVGWFSHRAGNHPLVSVLLADLACTAVVFAYTRVFKNTSIYDPYWSVIPIAIAVWFATTGWGSVTSTGHSILVVALVIFWGMRLTANWLRRWEGLSHIDWRYVDFEKKSGKWFWWVSFTGLQLVPTLIVYLGCLPLYPALVEPTEPPGIWSWLTAIWTFGAVVLELVADNQLVRFLEKNRQKSAVCNVGLWAYSRFPNYLGEVAFWWGLFFLGWLANPAWWWTVVGPLTMTAMFHFISIAMMEKRHLERRPGYAEAMKSTPRWVPWFPKNPANKGTGR